MPALNSALTDLFHRQGYRLCLSSSSESGGTYLSLVVMGHWQSALQHFCYRDNKSPTTTRTVRNNNYYYHPTTMSFFNDGRSAVWLPVLRYRGCSGRPCTIALACHFRHSLLLLKMKDCRERNWRDSCTFRRRQRPGRLRPNFCPKPRTTMTLTLQHHHQQPPRQYYV